MKRRTLPTAAALAATAALLLTACGDGDDSAKPNDKIAGADTGATTASASPEASKSADFKRPAMKFPADFTMVFDRTEPSDAKKAAALSDAENFVRAINYGIVQQDAEDAAYKFYSTPGGTAQAYAKKQIKQYVDGGWTVTGVQRYSRAEVDMAGDGKRASVSFCDDDSKFYGKEVKSHKILKTQPSAKDYYFFEIVMTASKEAEGLWTAQDIQVQKEATQCKA